MAMGVEGRHAQSPQPAETVILCEARDRRLTRVSGQSLMRDTRTVMPPASLMASLLALLSAARFCSVPTAVTAAGFSGLASTCSHSTRFTEDTTSPDIMLTTDAGQNK